MFCRPARACTAISHPRQFISCAPRTHVGSRFFKLRLKWDMRPSQLMSRINTLSTKTSGDRPDNPGALFLNTGMCMCHVGFVSCLFSLLLCCVSGALLGPVLLWPQQFPAGYAACPSGGLCLSYLSGDWAALKFPFLLGLGASQSQEAEPSTLSCHTGGGAEGALQPGLRGLLGSPLGCGLRSWEPHRALTELPCLPAGCSFLRGGVSLQELQPILPCCPGARGWLQSGAAGLPGSREPAGGRVRARDCLWGGRSSRPLPSRFVSLSKPFRVRIISLCRSLMSSCADSTLSWFAKVSVWWDFLHSPPTGFN